METYGQKNWAKNLGKMKYFPKLANNLLVWRKLNPEKTQTSVARPLKGQRSESTCMPPLGLSHECPATIDLTGPPAWGRNPLLVVLKKNLNASKPSEHPPSGDTPSSRFCLAFFEGLVRSVVNLPQLADLG